MSNWEWRQGGLYDGDVPILWAARDDQGALYLGVMADYEDVIASIPELLAENERLREALNRARCECIKARTWCIEVASTLPDKRAGVFACLWPSINDALRLAALDGDE
jgi:hypothetical protein